MDLTIAHLYPRHMNLYGDRGNVLALRYRALGRGIAVRVIDVDLDDPVDWDAVDLVFMGGGEDSHQARIYEDFLRRAEPLMAILDKGVPMLAICGAYQLLGHHYQTADGQRLQGLGYLDVTTEAGPTRAIGDVVCETPLFDYPKTLVGFENHGGRTFLGPSSQALGTVRLGKGNNGEDGTEGAWKNHTIGTYLHGSLLPKNPHLTDLLLEWALDCKYDGEVVLEPMESTREMAAHEVIVARSKIKHV
ncbi:MAG: glutamine amidotransferase [Sulfobacillus thermosulfidooxidans]|nr:MAG: glutamine amidotransferase [Sulfobacillus thermosulfidooxidans]